MTAKTQTRARPKRRAKQAKEPGQQSGEQNARGERLEWIVGGVSAIIVLTLAGFILYEALVKTGGEPDIGFTVEKGVTMIDGYALEILVHNHGHATVSNVEIAGEAEFADGRSETGRVTVDYLPAESETKVGLGFSQEVDPEQVRLRVVGYTYP